MTTLAFASPEKIYSSAPRVSNMPTCGICADSMVAAEASAFTADGTLSYLWTCETCGYGFVTGYQTKMVCD